jgi:ArsR family metal-binding transcriptional regulator
MQKVRLKLLRNLEKDFDIARKYAQSKDSKITPKQKQSWMRVMTYTAQVMNSIAQTFDEAEITKDLEKLEKMIREAVATDKDGSVAP